MKNTNAHWVARTRCNFSHFIFAPQQYTFCCNILLLYNFPIYFVRIFSNGCGWWKITISRVRRRALPPMLLIMRCMQRNY